MSTLNANTYTGDTLTQAPRVLTCERLTHFEKNPRYDYVIEYPINDKIIPNETIIKGDILLELKESTRDEHVTIDDKKRHYGRVIVNLNGKALLTDDLSGSVRIIGIALHSFTPQPDTIPQQLIALRSGTIDLDFSHQEYAFEKQDFKNPATDRIDYSFANQVYVPGDHLFLRLPSPATIKMWEKVGTPYRVLPTIQKLPVKPSFNQLEMYLGILQLVAEPGRRGTVWVNLDHRYTLMFRHGFMSSEMYQGFLDVEYHGKDVASKYGGYEYVKRLVGINTINISYPAKMVMLKDKKIAYGLVPKRIRGLPALPDLDPKQWDMFKKYVRYCIKTKQNLMVFSRAASEPGDLITANVGDDQDLIEVFDGEWRDERDVVRAMDSPGGNRPLFPDSEFPSFLYHLTQLCRQASIQLDKHIEANVAPGAYNPRVPVTFPNSFRAWAIDAGLFYEGGLGMPVGYAAGEHLDNARFFLNDVKNLVMNAMNNWVHGRYRDVYQAFVTWYNDEWVGNIMAQHDASIAVAIGNHVRQIATTIGRFHYDFASNRPEMPFGGMKYLMLKMDMMLAKDFADVALAELDGGVPAPNDPNAQARIAAGIAAGCNYNVAGNLVAPSRAKNEFNAAVTAHTQKYFSFQIDREPTLFPKRKIPVYARDLLRSFLEIYIDNDDLLAMLPVPGRNPDLKTALRQVHDGFLEMIRMIEDDRVRYYAGVFSYENDKLNQGFAVLEAELGPAQGGAYRLGRVLFNVVNIWKTFFEQGYNLHQNDPLVTAQRLESLGDMMNPRRVKSATLVNMIDWQDLQTMFFLQT